MLTEQQVAQFTARGFLNGGKVLNDQDVETLRAELDRVIADKDKPGTRQPVLIRNIGKKAGAPVWQIVNIWQASEAFEALMHSRPIVEAVAQLTQATELRIWHDQVQYKPAAIGGVNMWHQDAPYWPILAPMTEVTAWVALDDADVDNGCMSMVPGSHRWGNTIDFLHTLTGYDAMPAEWNGHRIEVVPCPVQRGEVHFHHALVWHGSGANTSGRPRRAVALHYMSQETRYVASGNHVMKPFVEVADGEVMQGKHFPRVWQAVAA